ncbi:hypothetical protein J6590_059663 [Homalodisca vitripennis]|nr:hypothetical protein J6590_059663 [Homalodisca vitripennis]
MSSSDEDQQTVPAKRKKGLKQVKYKSETIREARAKDHVGHDVAREFIDPLDQHSFNIGTGGEITLTIKKAHPSGKIPLKRKNL